MSHFFDFSRTSAPIVTLIRTLLYEKVNRLSDCKAKVNVLNEEKLLSC